jgi:carbon starvation protein CstA
MISFLTSIILLIAGYFIYGKFVEKIFYVDTKRETPATRLQDNVDFIPLPTWKIFLIQFLNIAGLGPIFGAKSNLPYNNRTNTLIKNPK